MIKTNEKAPKGEGRKMNAHTADEKGGKRTEVGVLPQVERRRL